MPTFGSTSLWIAFIATFVSIACLFLATHKAKKSIGTTKKQQEESKDSYRVQFIGLLLVWLSALTLTICCAILVVAFIGGDNSLFYVAQYRSNSVSSLALLFKFSGLWAGRAGSLLFWAWCISIFNALVAFWAWSGVRKARLMTGADTDPNARFAKTSAVKKQALDSAALAITQLVLLVFLILLIFDEAHQPFIPLPAHFLDSSGQLNAMAASWGMNILLEHWAMAIHPPTLFIGYAGLTIPFAYAASALIVNDPSRAWVDCSNRYTLVSWLFLGVGIGLGAIWAYMELTFGGYWAWDPVENASFLSWGTAVALVHSMTIYKQRGTFKRWAVMLACITFAFVIVGTFITRSGLVDSVHAFEPNLISLVLFGILIALPLLVGLVGLALRRKTFKDEAGEAGEAESLMSKDVAYYLNNVIMVVCMFFLVYMTLSSAFPSWMPFGGQALKAPTFSAIARPIGVLYCLILAVCPLLAWKKTNAERFFKQARLPALCAVVVFALLCVYFATTLLPIYMQTMAQGGEASKTLAAAGPFAYYAILTIVGFAAASLLFFNALFLLIRNVAKKNLRVQTIGGFLAHLSIGVLLVGLIGSSMYVFQARGYVPYQEQGRGLATSLVVRNYSLSFMSEEIETLDNGNLLFSVTFAVEKDGRIIGQITPQRQQTIAFSGKPQIVSHAAVLSGPTEDLYVVLYGFDDTHGYLLDVRINPLIWFVWVGFGLLMVGTAIAALGRRK